jgi:hypothetical protein
VEIISQAANFINQILLFLAYGGSSILKARNQTSFHTRETFIVEVELSASVGGFPVDFGGQCTLFRDDQYIQKGNRRSSFRNVVFSSLHNTGSWTKPENPVTPSVIHHRQNPLESTSMLIRQRLIATIYCSKYELAEVTASVLLVTLFCI